MEIRLSDFDPPTVTWLDDGGDPVPAPTFSLGAGEVEMLHLWAYVGDEWVEWTAELLVLVDGDRRHVEITDGARPFITAGSAGTASQHAWYSWERRWDPRFPRADPQPTEPRRGGARASRPRRHRGVTTAKPPFPK